MQTFNIIQNDIAAKKKFYAFPRLGNKAIMNGLALVAAQAV